MNKKVTKFDSATFLANAGLGRAIVELSVGSRWAAWFLLTWVDAFAASTS